MSGPTNFSTIGGVVTKGEAFAKLLHHLREAQDQAAVIAHLHQTEGNKMDTLLSKGWLGVAELLNRLVINVTKMAMGKMQ